MISNENQVVIAVFLSNSYMLLHFKKDLGQLEKLIFFSAICQPYQFYHLRRFAFSVNSSDKNFDNDFHSVA